MLAEAAACGHSRICCPVRLMTGADDPVAPPAMARALAGRLGDARVEFVPCCGHWPTVEAPEAAGRLVAETAATCLGSASRGETGGRHG
jgi:3-oxoadipate enol-lactonase